MVVKAIADTFTSINLEDIESPNCFVIDDALNKELNIPVFHDDQHGTAMVTLSGLVNAMKLLKRDHNEMTIAVSGAGAAGKAIIELLVFYGFKDIVVCDTKGAIFEGRPDLEENKYKKYLA